jgi:putative acetyltransferase
MVEIARDDPARADVRLLLDEHLADMFSTSPPESVHALDHSALSAPGVSFWTAREAGMLLGCGALKQLAGGGGEVKSMRTAPAARGRGVAALLLAEILAEAGRRGLERLYLETGSQDFFAPARRLYARHGFAECPPFADYTLDPNSVFMSLTLPAPDAPSRRLSGKHR